jgi:molecular chaperone GrpE
MRTFSTKSDATADPSAPSDADSPTTPEETTEAAPPTDDSAAAPSSPEANKLADLENQIKDLKDNLLRSLAEQENTRRIAKRDVEQARSFAISSFAKSLLDTSDNLSRALDAVPEELRHDHVNHPVLANLYEGISMTDDGLIKAFAKNGLVKFGQRGEKFDPNKHEALFEYPDPNGEPGCIGQVMKAGFMLNNRVVRPAEVGVVKAA